MTEHQFQFLEVPSLSDADLTLTLAEVRPAHSNPWRVPAYLLQMLAESMRYAGRIRLRVGWNENIIKYAGHIGYAVEPAFRGRHYAERACRLILPLARCHGLERIWITCQPDNAASRRTLERLGATYAGIVDVPVEYPLGAGVERRKMCFWLSTSHAEESQKIELPKRS